MKPVQTRLNLQNGNISYTFPQLSFSRSQTSLYETITGSSVRGKRNWYQDIYFSYNSKAIRKGSKTLQADSTFNNTLSQGLNHNLQFNYNQKILGVFNINPSLSYKETWVDETTNAYLDSETGVIVEEQKKGFAARRTFNLASLKSVSCKKS